MADLDDISHRLHRIRLITQTGPKAVLRRVGRPGHPKEASSSSSLWQVRVPAFRSRSVHLRGSARQYLIDSAERMNLRPEPLRGAVQANLLPVPWAGFPAATLPATGLDVVSPAQEQGIYPPPVGKDAV